MCATSKTSTTATTNKTAKSSLKILAPIKKLLESERGKGNRTCKADRVLIQGLAENGYKPGQIAAYLGVCRKTVTNWLESGRLENRHHLRGRKRTVLTPGTLKMINNIATEYDLKDEPLTTRIWLAECKKRGWSGNERTLRDAKKELGLVTIKAKLKPERAFYVVNRNKRVEIALERLGLTQDQIERTIFIDESEGQVQAIRQRVVKKKNRKLRKKYAKKVDKKEEKVHFLIAIGNGWKSKFEHLPLRRLVDRDENGKALTKTLATGRRKKGDPANKKLNLANEGQTWNKNTLMPIFERWARTKAFKTCYAVLLDNAPSHSAVRKFLQSKGIKILEHPPHSPDMNIIELVHQTIKQRARNHAPMNNHELLAAYKEEFRKFNVHTEWLKYVEKYPQVLQQIVDSKGMPTDY